MIHSGEKKPVPDMNACQVFIIGLRNLVNIRVEVSAQSCAPFTGHMCVML